jgi:hypothetical protein
LHFFRFFSYTKCMEDKTAVLDPTEKPLVIPRVHRRQQSPVAVQEEPPLVTSKPDIQIPSISPSGKTEVPSDIQQLLDLIEATQPTPVKLPPPTTDIPPMSRFAPGQDRGAAPRLWGDEESVAATNMSNSTTTATEPLSIPSLPKDDPTRIPVAAQTPIRPKSLVPSGTSEWGGLMAKVRDGVPSDPPPSIDTTPSRRRGLARFLPWRSRPAASQPSVTPERLTIQEETLTPPVESSTTNQPLPRATGETLRSVYDAMTPASHAPILSRPAVSESISPVRVETPTAELPLRPAVTPLDTQEFQVPHPNGGAPLRIRQVPDNDFDEERSAALANANYGGASVYDTRQPELVGEEQTNPSRYREIAARAWEKVKPGLGDVGMVAIGISARILADALHMDTETLGNFIKIVSASATLATAGTTALELRLDMKGVPEQATPRRALRIGQNVAKKITYACLGLTVGAAGEAAAKDLSLHLPELSIPNSHDTKLQETPIVVGNHLETPVATTPTEQPPGVTIPPSTPDTTDHNLPVDPIIHTNVLPHTPLETHGLNIGAQAASAIIEQPASPAPNQPTTIDQLATHVAETQSLHQTHPPVSPVTEPTTSVLPTEPTNTHPIITGDVHDDTLTRNGLHWDLHGNFMRHLGEHGLTDANINTAKLDDAIQKIAEQAKTGDLGDNNRPEVIVYLAADGANGPDGHPISDEQLKDALDKLGILIH